MLGHVLGTPCEDVLGLHARTQRTQARTPSPLADLHPCSAADLSGPPLVPPTPREALSGPRGRESAIKP